MNPFALRPDWLSVLLAGFTGSNVGPFTGTVAFMPMMEAE
jgi:hypothetical protein